ncbi:MAG: hypothetical protein ACREDA_09880 [Methylocella sp.]
MIRATPTARSAAASTRGAFYTPGTEDVDIVGLGVLFGLNRLGGSEHDVESGVDADVEPAIFAIDRGHGGTSQRLRKGVKRDDAHGNAVRLFD